MTEDREPDESAWLTIAQTLSEAAADAAETANALSRRAQECYERAGVAAPTSDDPKSDRILWNPGRECIDEIVIHDALVHVEQMTDRCWWIGVYKGDQRWSGHFSCERHKDGMQFTEQDAELPWGRDEEHR